MSSPSVSGVLGDAWDVYTILFRRSVPIAAAVYAVVNSVDLVDRAVDDRGAEIGLSLLGLVLLLAGPVLVQGALVKMVREVHEATAREASTALLRDALRNLGSLVLASLLYGIGVTVGLVLLIVPGLLVAARWSLMAPGIMLEGRTTGEAQTRSREIVRGRTENGLGDRTMLALGVVATSFLLTSVFVGVLAFLAAGLFGTALAWIVGVAVSAVAAPYQAHVLSVLYYRLVEPDRATIHPDVQTART